MSYVPVRHLLRKPAFGCSDLFLQILVDIACDGREATADFCSCKICILYFPVNQIQGSILQSLSG